MEMEEFHELRLVGGTALAMQIGHRRSIDLDFFGTIDFESLNTFELFKKFQNVVPLKKSKHINIFSINNIKVDFVNYSYPWLKDVFLTDKLRLAYPEDISAMKLAAITNRGSKKDFVDLYFLLKQFSLAEMLKFYIQKYHDGSEYLVLKSLTYFEDAEKDQCLEMINPLDWNEVKTTIKKAVITYHNQL